MCKITTYMLECSIRTLVTTVSSVLISWSQQILVDSNVLYLVVTCESNSVSSEIIEIKLKRPSKLKTEISYGLK